MQEIWKDIKEYEGLYQVSNMGNVKSLNYNRTGEERILRPWVDSNEYLRVKLYREGNCKKLLVHRLVLMTFNPIDNMDKFDVNHRDENKKNNNLDNLEWCNRSYNINYGTRNQKISKPIIQLDPTTNKVINVFNSAMEAKRQGFHNGNISNCCKNRYTKHSPNIYLGYKWQYMSDYIKSIDSRIKKVVLFDKEYNY